jgi:hypothetical protein
MDFPKDSAGLNALERIVRKFAKRLKRYPILKYETEDDLAQDLYICLIGNSEKIRSAFAVFSGFIAILCISYTDLIRSVYHHAPNVRFS